MDNSKKNLWISVGVVVVLVLLVWWFAARKSSDDVSSGAQTGSEEVDSTEDTTEGSVNPASAPALTYQQALLKYKDARIQLDKSCQAHPSQVTYKNGTSVMLDNRANVARTVKLGSTFSIKAYGFKIVKLQSAT